MQLLQYMINTFYSENIPWLLGEQSCQVLFLQVAYWSPVCPFLLRDLSDRNRGGEWL